MHSKQVAIYNAQLTSYIFTNYKVQVFYWIVPGQGDDENALVDNEEAQAEEVIQ